MATLVTSAPATAAAACPSCGTVLEGAYCHACGERRRAPEELSARHFFRELGEDVFDLDSRAVRSFKLLVARPGFLTLEFIAGRRQPYLGPLRMYLPVFALTLFLSLLVPQVTPSQRSGLLDAFRRVVHWVATRRGITDEAAERAVGQAVAQHFAWLSVLIPLMFAAFLYAAFRRRRKWFGEHLVFATHFGTVNFLAGLVIIPIQLAVLRYNSNAATITAALALIPLLAWLMIAVRRVYGTGVPVALGASLGLFLAFSIAQSLTSLLALGTAVLKIAYFGG
jgi:hypothetical protein